MLALEIPSISEKACYPIGLMSVFWGIDGLLGSMQMLPKSVNGRSWGAGPEVTLEAWTCWGLEEHQTPLACHGEKPPRGARGRLRRRSHRSHLLRGPDEDLGISRNGKARVSARSVGALCALAMTHGRMPAADSRSPYLTLPYPTLPSFGNFCAHPSIDLCTFTGISEVEYRNMNPRLCRSAGKIATHCGLPVASRKRDA